MLKAVVQHDGSGRIRSISVTGHAGYAAAGEDIVCAAATAILTTVLSALTDLVGIEPQYQVEEGNIRLELTELPADENQAEQAILLLETGALGLRQIALGYGDYIQVIEG